MQKFETLSYIQDQCKSARNSIIDDIGANFDVSLLTNEPKTNYDCVLNHFIIKYPTPLQLTIDGIGGTGVEHDFFYWSYFAYYS